MAKLCESAVEEMAIEELQSLGYTYIAGVDFAPDAPNSDRNSYSDILLISRLQSALLKINPTVPAEAVQRAAKKLSRIATSNLLADNEEFQKMLVDGVPVEYRKNGDIKGDYVHVVDFENPLNNEFLVVNQYTIVQNNNNKRTDVLLLRDMEK
ncbi:type I restriction endonuclease [Hungatella sp.]|uniref:type I restriction endonuclease n=1 Tax=Hungatella sp. TaxID=2613924 RepID=UPI00399F853D